DVGETDVALERFATVHNAMPKSVFVLVEWSYVLRREARAKKLLLEQNYRDSEQKLLQAIAMDSNELLPRCSLGDLFLERNRPRDALKSFEQAVRLDRWDWRGWAGCGKANEQLKRDAKAAKA